MGFGETSEIQTAVARIGDKLGNNGQTTSQSRREGQGDETVSAPDGVTASTTSVPRPGPLEHHLCALGKVVCVRHSASCGNE